MKDDENAPNEVYMELARVLPTADFSVKESNTSSSGPLFETCMVAIGGHLATSNFSSLAKLLQENISSLLSCDSLAIYLYDETGGEAGEIWDESFCGFEGEPRHERLPADVGFVGSAIDTGLPVSSMRATLEKRFDARVDEHGAGRTTRLLCAPMKNSRGKVVGVISVCDVETELKNVESKSFSPAETLFLQAIANQVATAVDSCYSRNAIQLSSRVGKLHGDLASAMAVCYTSRALCAAAAEIIREALDAEAVTIYVIEGTGPEAKAVRTGVCAPFEQEVSWCGNWPPGCSRECGIGLNKPSSTTEGMIGSVLAPSGRKLVDVPYVSEASRQEFHPNIDQKYEPPARNMLAVHFEEPFEDFDKDPDSLINGMMGVIKVINKVTFLDLDLGLGRHTSILPLPNSNTPSVP